MSRGRTRAWLLAILAAAMIVRVAHLALLMRLPGFGWSDADGYMAAGARMAHGGWHWSYEAIDYFQFVKAPLYPVILSALALLPRYPLNAALFQIALQVIAGGAALFVIGRTVHSARAGLIAAAVGSCLLGLNGGTAFTQEDAAVPLALVGLALMLRAIERSLSPRAFVAVGAFLAIAALVRSTPLYFVVPAALLHIAMARARTAAARQALALVVGFFLVVAPYSAFISARQGHTVVIDDIGSRTLVMRDTNQPLTYVPGLAGSLHMLWSDLTSAPAQFAQDRWDYLRAMFLLRGVHVLQMSTPAAGTPAGAMLWKAFVHATMDLPAAMIALLAPFGFVLARNRRASALLLLWVLIALGLMNTFLWGSARYRAVIDSQMLVAAAVVLAGSWRRPSPRHLIAPAAASLILAIIVVPSVPVTLSGRAPYGIAPWNDGDQTSTNRLVGAGGFTIRRFQPDIRLKLTPPRGVAADIELRIDGRTVQKARTRAGEPLLLHYPFPQRNFTFIEILAGETGGAAAPLDVELLQRR